MNKERSMISKTWMLRTCLGVVCLWGVTARAADFPDPALDNKSLLGDLFKGNQTAVLAGGCFWCVEAVFQQIAGVEKVVSGYSGGDAASAHYEMVSTGKTGHAESVQVTYDPRKISYGQLLKVFFDVAHDPTQRDRQGPDVGPQYRSMIFYSNPEQKKIAEAYVKQLEQAKVFPSPIVTQVVELKSFYPAEEHHQNYCNRNPKDRYVVNVAMPKVEKAKTKVPELLKK
jgi:peptide-methionine (S)-S-oxide reductase